MQEATDAYSWQTRGQAAAYLSCSPRTIDRWIKAGDLSANRVGRIVRIDKAELDRLVTGGESA